MFALYTDYRVATGQTVHFQLNFRDDAGKCTSLEEYGAGSPMKQNDEVPGPVSHITA